MTQTETLTPTVENILAVYAARTPQHEAEGMAWYEAAHLLARTLDPARPDQAAGVIAALSPMMPWGRNERLAIAAYEAPLPMNSGIGNNIRKANAIVAGAEANDILGGDKVRRFWQTIADPTNPNNEVTVDRHAHDIAVGVQCVDSDRKLGKRRYKEFADCYRDAAAIVGIGAAQLQAITWVTWREAVGITQ